ncbi:MAG: OmpA family protein [Saprospiraceae bacterium]|nr:OmpA family protein [Saprospiraceae bacterium]
MMRNYTLFFFALILLSSCVSNKKYLLELDARRAAEERETTLRNELTYAKDQVSNLTTQVTDLSRTNGTLEYINNNLRTENEDLKGRMNNLSSSSSTEIEQLNRNLQEKTEALSKREQAIQELQTEVNQRNTILQNLYINLDSTLRIFEAEAVKTEFIEGRIIVLLPADVLFSAGSERFTRKGLDIIAKFAPALANNPNIDIAVEGHTDNSKPRNRSYSDNWALSSEQALAVARILTKDFSIASNQVSANGRSEFQPRASNASSSGQAQNRRIEIIITPKTVGLLRLMERKLANG